VPPGSRGGAGIFGTAKCSDTSTLVFDSLAFAFTRCELRASSAYGRRYAASRRVDAPGMSDSSNALASMRSALLSGCGWLTTGAEARRLSEKLFLTARDTEEPSLARKRWFCAMSCTWPPIFLKKTMWRCCIRPA